MNRSGIGIPDPIKTSPTNFETLEHCCEVLTASLIDGEALDLRAHSTKMKEGRESGRELGLERRVDRKERDLRVPNETLD